MVMSESRLPTENASRYLQQLCKHFEHRLQVSYSPEKGRIDYEASACNLTAEPQTLVMRCEAPDDEALAKIEHVVASHLVRFAFREELDIKWARLAA